MIEREFYLTDPEGLPALVQITDLAEDEVESIVGRFRKNHWRFPGMLRGQVRVGVAGEVKIVHHFTKKVLWRSV